MIREWEVKKKTKAKNKREKIEVGFLIQFLP